jgi:hypothetical protein
MVQAIVCFVVAAAIGLWLVNDISTKNHESEMFRNACHANGGTYTPMANPDDSYCDLPGDRRR